MDADFAKDVEAAIESHRELPTCATSKIIPGLKLVSL